MIIPDPIKCPKCGTIVISDSKNLANYYMQDDIRCGCGEIVVYCTKIIW